MKIKAITKHKYKGKEYNSLKEIKEEIHNTIGLQVLDKINRTCPLQKHKDYFKLLDLLCSKEIRNVLVECLTATYEEEEFFDTFPQSELIEKNILDV